MSVCLLIDIYVGLMTQVFSVCRYVHLYICMHMPLTYIPLCLHIFLSIHLFTYSLNKEGIALGNSKNSHGPLSVIVLGRSLITY